MQIMFCIESLLFDEFVDGVGEGIVFFGNNIAGIVGREPYLYCVPGIGPCGMMVLFFGKDGHSGHECKCFTEIGKGKFAV